MKSLVVVFSGVRARGFVLLVHLYLKSTCYVNLLSKLSIICKEWRVIVLFVLLILYKDFFFYKINKINKVQWVDFKLENVLLSFHSLKTMGLGAFAPLFLRNGELLGYSPIRMFCRSLFGPFQVYFFFWPLCCLFFFNRVKVMLNQV